MASDAVRPDDQTDSADFRREILHHLSLVPAAASLYVLMFAFDANSLASWVPILAFAVVAILVGLARRTGDVYGSLVLVVGLLASLIATVLVYPQTSVACLLSLVVGVASVLLGPAFGLLSALVTSLIVLGIHATWFGVTSDVVTVTVFLSWSVAILTWAATRPVYRTLQWAWSSHLDSLRKTEELRDRQAELSQLSKSLQQTCRQLEHLNQELARARFAADESRRLKDEFAAAVSHELRTPLNLVIGFSELMVLSPDDAYGDALPAMYRGDVEAIYRNACHISNLIDDILDLSQIEAHRMALQKEAVFLATVVEGAISSVTSLFRDKNLRLVADLPENLPPLNVDPTRIRQVLINLLANAARCTDTGGITIGAVQQDHEIVVSVTDTGIGLASGELSGIFEPFRQGRDRDRQRAGNGLGLAISRRFVEMHGGSIWATSQIGQGSTFSFSLPLSEQVIVPTGASRQEQWLAAQVAKQERTILALDESGDAARILQRYLDGYRVVRVSTLAEAEQIAAEESPRAVVLASETLPERLPSRCRDISLRLGVPTAYCPLQISGDAPAKFGVVDYVTKPISLTRLRAALRQLRKRVRSVLIVDDDPEMARLLARMVRSSRQSCQVWEARDGRAGLQLACAEHPDVILLDLLMPEMDGYTMLETMCQDPDLRPTPVIVITARGKDQRAVVARTIHIESATGFNVGTAMRCLRASLDALLAPAASGTAAAPPVGWCG
jgi:signal transduction histidine kinase/CheY-like chemotaxis protein